VAKQYVKRVEEAKPNQNRIILPGEYIWC
jgi:hypothetical protein